MRTRIALKPGLRGPKLEVVPTTNMFPEESRTSPDPVSFCEPPQVFWTRNVGVAAVTGWDETWITPISRAMIVIEEIILLRIRPVEEFGSEFSVMVIV